jgi:hypothetical protein
MRTLFFCICIALIASCGQSEQSDHSDTLADTATAPTTIADTAVFETVNAKVTEISIPCMIQPDSLPEGKFALNEQACNVLLLPGFDYASYKSVWCVGRSTIAGSRALWIELSSEPEYDGSPFATDVIVVLYNEHAEPVDVYNAASSDATYYISSYVRHDSVFTLEHGEMEDITITTTAIGISKAGFMPQPSVTKKFPGTQAGSETGSTYAAQYFSSRRSQ